MPKFVLLLVLACAAVPPYACAGELPRAKPEEVGLDPAKLAKVDAKTAELIEKRQMPGAVVGIARKGKVAYLKAFGTFKEDSIVRIYSMTKPITVVAALMLVDEGKLALDDPVAKYIPAFAKLRILGKDEPPRAMTIQDLCQHTSGLTYGLFSNTPVDKQYREVDILARGSTLEEMVAKLAGLPLIFEPGERWHYGVSTDVLGRVVEIVGKMPFDAFLQARVFKPLGMVDTAFSVPDDKLARFVPTVGLGGHVIEKPETSRFREKPKLLSGGGGLVSTMSDYMRFLLMLAQGGTIDGVRLLKPASVQRMTTNRLSDDLIPIQLAGMPFVGVGFGLGVSVRVKALGAGTRKDTWGWGGAASTMFFVSPRDELAVITLIQRMPMWNGFDRSLRPLIYDAVRAPEPVGAK